MNPPDDAASAVLAKIPSRGDEPVFPTPWAARAFALTVALNERGFFSWPEWSEILGKKLAEAPATDSADEVYWRAWLAAREQMLERKAIADEPLLAELREAWRHAAEATPHGQPIELRKGQAESEPARSVRPSAVMKSAAKSSSTSMT